MDDFSDDVAVVTGGTRGIGRAISRALTGAGATVIAVYRADDQSAKQTADELAGTAGAFHARPLDVRDAERVEAVLAEAADAHGTPTMLVNNAGIVRNHSLARMDEEVWDEVLATNLTGAFNCLRAVGRRMLVGDGGAVVNVSSVAGLRGWAGQANYAASKSGLVGLTRSAARELGPRGLRVNAVAPGYVETELFDALDESMDDAFVEGELARIPLDRLADPGEVADAVTYLLSDRASYVNGAVLRVDGGLLT